MSRDLHSEIGRLRAENETLMAELAIWREKTGTAEMINRLRKHIRNNGVCFSGKKLAQLAIVLSDEKKWSFDRLTYALNFPGSDSVSVYVYWLRKAGFEIENIWGEGFRMSASSAARVRAIAQGGDA